MAQLKSGLELKDGETLVMELEAELWATSANPFAQALGSKRVVEVYNAISCYVFNTGRRVKYLLPTSVKEVGYTKEATCGCFCPSYHLYYESFTQSTSVLLSATSDAEAQKVVDSFYSAISN